FLSSREHCSDRLGQHLLARVSCRLNRHGCPHRLAVTPRVAPGLRLLSRGLRTWIPVRPVGFPRLPPCLRPFRCSHSKVGYPGTIRVFAHDGPPSPPTYGRHFAALKEG